MSRPNKTERPPCKVEPRDPTQGEAAHPIEPGAAARQRRLGIDDDAWRHMLRALKEPSEGPPAEGPDPA